MLVLAKPRIKGSEDVILEDDDITEDYLERSYTELLGETVTQTSLNRSLSARVRRRERERSPEQFGMMFRTLPPLSSGYHGIALPVSSQTLPSRLAPTELHNSRATNGLQRNGLCSTGQLMKEDEVDGNHSTVETSKDSDSVKDLGETTDLLNLTHVMKMDPGEKTLTLSPVQKQVYSHRTIELSDDETDGEEDQTDEEEEDDDDEEEEQIRNTNKRDESEKGEDGKTHMEKIEHQDIKTTKESKDIEETAVLDGPTKDSVDKSTSSPLVEDKPQSHKEAKQEKKSLFGSNSKLSLFKRMSSTKDKQDKEKVEAPTESTTSAKTSRETPSGSSEGGPRKSSSVEAPNSQQFRSHSATCSLL